MHKKEYMSFLVRIGTKVATLVARDSAVSIPLFHKHCESFCRKEDLYQQEYEKAQKNAETDSRLRDNNEGIPPETGMEWYISIENNKLKGFWSQPLPFSPDNWLSNYYGYIIVSYPCFREPTPEERLMCEYVVLGLIADEALEVPKVDRLCSIDDDEYRCLVWDHLQFEDKVAGYEGGVIRPRLELAFENVKADLTGTGTIEQQLALQNINALDEWIRRSTEELNIYSNVYCKNRDYLGHRISIVSKLNINSIIEKLKLENKIESARRLEKLLETLLANIKNFDKNLKPNNPIHIPDFGLCDDAASLKNALQRALPYLEVRSSEFRVSD